MNLIETAVVPLIASGFGAAFGAYLGYRLAKRFEIERMIRRQDEEKIRYLQHICHDLQDMMDRYKKAEPFIFNTGKSKYPVRRIGFRESGWLRQNPAWVYFSWDLAHYLDIVYSNFRDLGNFKQVFLYCDDLLWQYTEGKISEANKEKRIAHLMKEYQDQEKSTFEEDIPITFALLNVEIVLTAINNLLPPISPFRIEDVFFEKLPSSQDEHANIQVYTLNPSAYAKDKIFCGIPVEKVPLVKSFSNSGQEGEKLKEYLLQKVGIPLKEADKRWRFLRGLSYFSWGVTTLSIMIMVLLYFTNLSWTNLGLLTSGLVGVASTAAGFLLGYYKRRVIPKGFKVYLRS